ncbi:MAG TPA: Zn-ribbon domain-containing OB-fold protein [Myxococcales bacterium]|nr:Zn-ribbon domain-containing OB-fold protein [Myxococcales bacterium]HIK85297.1 Zn-ribbon domain-containing OB-fold protein [Myxococcales bacterium]
MSDRQMDGDKPSEHDEDVTLLRVPVSLDYDYSAGVSASRFLRGIEQGKLLGQRCPVDGRVYFPSRGSCPQHAVTFGDETVDLSDKGTIVTFSIVRVPSANIPLELPYIAVNVVLDGADTILMHVLDANPEDVHMGMRVQAVWKPREEWTTSTANILYFRAIDEPDADYDQYKEHI